MVTTKRERKALAKKVRAAADYIDRTGLYKGNLWEHSWNGPSTYTEAVKRGVKCCTLGAIFGHGAEEALEPLETYLAETHPRVKGQFVQDGKPFANIPRWNDTKSRRKKDVVELLRGFADRLESGE